MAKETVESLCEKARQAVARGSNEEALDCYRQALGLQPDNPHVHYGLGTVCVLRGDLPSAAFHFMEVTRLDPMRAGGHINLGAVYNRLEQFDDAIPVLLRGIQLDKNRCEGHYNLGLIYQRQGQLDLAIQAFREAARANPRMAEALCKIATIYAEQMRFALAIGHYRQALEIRPTWEKALRGLKQAERAQEMTEPKSTASSRTDAGAPSPAGQVAVPALDPSRLVDPRIHGELLRSLHGAINDSQARGRNFLTTLEDEIEPAIKKLSNILASPAGSSAGLENCLKDIEATIADLRAHQQSLQTSINQVRLLGEQLLKI